MTQQQVGPLGSDVAVTHILVVAEPTRSRDFWVDVLGAELYREYGEPAWYSGSPVPGCCWSAGAGRPLTSRLWSSRRPPTLAGSVTL